MVSIDPHGATVTLSDGSILKADVLVGADGAHSVTRGSISHIKPVKGAHTAFRFLITRKAAMEDPTTSEFASSLSSMDIWYGEDRKVVLYPCANNTLLNFVCIHPAELSDPGDGEHSYSTSASKEQLVNTYKSFDPVSRVVGGFTVRLWSIIPPKAMSESIYRTAARNLLTVTAVNLGCKSIP